MTYENTASPDLTDEVKKQSTPSIAETDDTWDVDCDDYYDDYDEEEMEPPPF